MKTKNVEDIYPLSPMQQGLLFHTLHSPEAGEYVVQIVFTLAGELRAEDLERSWREVIARHTTLRAGFFWRDLKQPVQVVNRRVDFSLSRLDWRSKGESEQESALEELLVEDRRQGYELEQPPLMRCFLIQLGEDLHHFVWSHHHLLLDGWSLPLVMGEVFTFYEKGQAFAARARRPRPYRDFIQWLKQQDDGAPEAFWSKALEGFDRPTALGVDRAQETDSEGDEPEAGETGYDETKIFLSEATTEGLNQLAKQHQLTPFTLLQGAWALLLSHYSQDDDLVFGAAVSGRPPALRGVESMVGLFINTVPVRVRIEARQEILPWLLSLQEEQSKALDHSYSPLLDVQGWSEIETGRPLFESLLVFENFPLGAAVERGETSLEMRGVRFLDRTNFPLTLKGTPGERLRLRSMFDRKRFDPATIERLLMHFENLLNGMVSSGGQGRLGDLTYLSPAEERQLLETWGGAEEASSETLDLFSRFVETAESFPEAEALVDGEERLTYAELRQQAHDLARHLRAQGVGPEVAVGLLLGRSVHQVVAILAVLEAGGFYVPLDPVHPIERSTYVLEHAGVRCVLTTKDLHQILPEQLLEERSITVLQLDGLSSQELDQQEPHQSPASRPLTPANPHQLAYVIYTSGSTGRPKGVAISHRQVLRLFRTTAPFYGFSENDVWPIFHSYAFDVSVWEIWGALLHGGRAVVVPREVAQAPRQLWDLIEREKVTVLNQTPSAFLQLSRAEEELIEEGRAPEIQSLRFIVFAGEALDFPTLKPWFSRHGHADEAGKDPAPPKLVNMYGITETTVHVTIREVTPDDLEGRVRSAVGRAMPDLGTYLLDPRGRPVPIGVPGEIHVFGPGLARGYFDRPGITASRFVPNPRAGLSEKDPTGGRVYRSGDLARWLETGELEFLGRRDHQVQIRGFRVEPGEVEGVLAEHADVHQAVVLVHEKEPGDLRLVAYVVPRSGLQLQETALRQHCEKNLPEYMVPSGFLLLDAFPLNANSKVDRRALPDPSSAWEVQEAKFIAPRNQLEEVIANLWAEVLGLEKVSVEDSFFHIGGHSLLAVRLISRLRKVFQVELPFRSLFRAPTVAGIAKAVQEEQQRATGSALPPIEPVSRDQDLPLSFSQRRLWFLDQLQQNSSVYNLMLPLRFRGDVSIPALMASLDEIQRRHEVLRTTFRQKGERPVQIIEPFAPRALPIVDLSALPAEEAWQRVGQLSREAAARSIDLEQGPLWSNILLKAQEDAFQLLNLSHHIVFDGSIPVFITELITLYQSLSQGRPALLPALPVQYADFAAWQEGWMQGDTFDQQLDFWRERLGDDPPRLELPLDRPRPALQTTRGERRFFAFSDDLSERFPAFARSAGATPFMVGLAAFAALLSRLSGQRDLCLGTPIDDRPLAEFDGMIGCFVNTVVLRLNVTSKVPFERLIEAARDITLDAHQHKNIPFEALVEALQPERSLSHNPLFQVMFVLNNAQPRRANTTQQGLSLSEPQVRTRTARFDLMTAIWSSEADYLGSFEYNSDLFDPSTIQRLEGQFLQFLEAAISDPTRPVDQISLLAPSQRHQLINEWNDTAADFPRAEDDSLLTSIQKRAEHAPDAAALFEAERICTYGELLARADSLAAFLQTRGARPGTLVGIHQQRSIEMVTSVLAVLSTGAAYVPLATQLPEERLKLLIDDHDLNLLLIDAPQAERLGRIAGERDLVLVDSSESTSDLPVSWRHDPNAKLRPVDVPPESLAYIIFTSGSTGRPKGVAVSQQAVLNLFAWIDQRFAFNADDRVLFVTALSFDLSVFDLLGILGIGASVRIASENELQDPQILAELLWRERISFWDSAPAALQQVAPFLEGRSEGRASGALRQVFLSGDWIPLQLPEQVRAAFPETAITSLGGATEATVWSNFHEIEAIAPHWVSIPYGRPMANAQYHVLDARLEPCPIGVEGDLYIAGSCLATGYAQAQTLTASKYLPDPLSSTPGERMYATGDRARVWRDGTLEFLGRRDAQVKIRGFRIELGEIETHLAAHPAVQAAAVIAHRDQPSDTVRTGGYLVAWVVLEDSSFPLDRLRVDLGRQLPEYMIPSRFQALESLPTSATGKLDRKALMQLEAPSDNEDETSFQGPRDPLEEILAGIWREALGRDRIDVHSSFFELGGESLKAAQVVSRLRQALDLELPMRLFFERPTLAQLAEGIAELRSGSALQPRPPLTSQDRDQDIPLSFAQERLWFLDQLDPGNALYNVPTVSELHGPLDLDLLKDSLARILDRHEALRTTFTNVDGRPVQRIAEAIEPPLELIDLRDRPAEGRFEEAMSLATEEARRGFDLEQGPLLRFTVVRMAEDHHLAVLNMHHIVSDAWSLWVFLRELATFYSQARQNADGAETESASTLAPLAVQYPDFALWQRGWLQGETLEHQLNFWKEHLASAPPLFELPADQRRPATPSYRGHRLGLQLDEALTARLKELSRERGVTLFMTLLAAFKTLLHRLSGRVDPLVGTLVANRTQAEIEPLIGFFINTLALYSDLAPSLIRGEARFVDVLAQVRETVLAAFAHQDVPFEKLVTELGIERQTSHAPIAQVMFGLETAMTTPGSSLGADPMNFSGLTLEPRNVAIETAKFDLTLTVRDDEDRLSMMFVAARDLFDRTTVQRWQGQFQHLLETLVQNPERAIHQSDLLLTAERHQLLAEWNEAPAYERAERIHDGIRPNTEIRPAAIAILEGDHHLSYGDLGRRASALAQHLRAHGVGPERPAGVFLPRSRELAIAMLATLEAGGIYLPLDPSYPAERRELMLAESQAAVVMFRGQLSADSASVLDGADGSPIWLDLDALDLTSDKRAALKVEASPDNLAYLLFTSGSTGRPKGVMGHHLGLANRLAFAVASGQVHAGDRVLQRASISFDLSLIEMLSTLTAGGTLAFADATEAADPLALTRLIARQRLSVAFLTPSILQVMTEQPEARQCRSLRAASSGAEAISVDLQNRFFELFDAEFFNRYGPTETAVSVTSWTCRPGAARRSVPIGRPMAQTRLYLLDRQGRPVPTGAPGELVLGGMCVARGYLKRPAQTASAFVPDAWSPEPGGRAYRTGDLVRYLPNGDVEFLGRRDHQVKIRGFRIELGEVEGVLEDLPQIREAVALVRAAGGGGQRLVAYVVPSKAEEWPNTSDLRAATAQRLPDYMVPTAIVLLSEFPRLPNGKLDRAALPEPDLGTAGGERSKNPVEDVIAGIWTDVLGQTAPAPEHLHSESHFFELGGHSLLATQVLARLRETFAIDLPLADLFEATTLGELAHRVRIARRGFELPTLKRWTHEESPPLSFAQTRLWLADRLQPGDPSYNVPSAVRLRGPVQISALRQSFSEVMRRHEILRTRFSDVDGEPQIEVLSDDIDNALPEIDLRGVEASDRYRLTHQLVRAEALRSFDLARGPMMRSALLRLAEDDAVLLSTLHHIAADGWSTGLLIAEVSRRYEAFASGVAASDLDETRLQYSDFAAWQHSWLRDEVLEHHVDYWREQLDGAPRVLDLPGDRPRPPRRSSRGATYTFVLDPELRQALTDLGREQDATPFMTLLAIYQLLLARLAGQDDLVVGASIANRGHQQLESMVGFFVNNLSLRADLSADPTFRQFLKQIRETSLGAFEHQDLPFEVLVDRLGVARDPAITPIFQALFVYQNLPQSRTIEAAGLSLQPLELRSVTAKYDLSLFISELDGSLQGTFEYSTDLFEETTVKRWAKSLEKLAREATAQPDLPTSRLDMAEASEVAAAIDAFNVDLLSSFDMNG